MERSPWYCNFVVSSQPGTLQALIFTSDRGRITYTARIIISCCLSIRRCQGTTFNTFSLWTYIFWHPPTFGSRSNYVYSKRFVYACHQWSLITDTNNCRRRSNTFGGLYLKRQSQRWKTLYPKTKCKNESLRGKKKRVQEGPDQEWIECLKFECVSVTLTLYWNE